MPKLYEMKHFNVKNPEVITGEQIRDDWNPCYDPTLVYDFPRGLTIFDFLNSTDVPVGDRLWAAVKWCAAAGGENPLWFGYFSIPGRLPEIYKAFRVWNRNKDAHPFTGTVGNAESLKQAKSLCRSVLRKYKAAAAKEAKKAAPKAKAKARRKLKAAA